MSHSLSKKIKAAHLAVTLGEKVSFVAAKTGLSTATIQRIKKTVQDKPLGDWKNLLSDNRENSGRRAVHKVDPRFWKEFKNDYLRLEAPSIAACYDRTAIWAEQNNMITPPIHLIYRAIKKIPKTEITVCREGLVALDRMFPSQRRHTVGMRALEAINGDGWKMDLFVQQPPLSDGTQRGIIRPSLWVWQDVATRKIVGYRLAETESADQIVSALINCALEYGVPENITLDNTRAASAKFLSGNRKRGNADQLSGIFEEAGIEVHRTGLLPTAGKTASGGRRHVGRGQAKPVERFFRVLADRVAKHPDVAGFYTGRSTESKPENYNSNAGANWDLVEGIINEVILQWNDRIGLAEPLKGEKSPNAKFEELIAKHPLRPTDDSTVEMLLCPAETTKIARDGTFRLKAGAAVGFGTNRYSHEILLNHVGETLLVRYDGTDLHGPVIVTDKNGKRICIARCDIAAGFGDRDKAQEHNRTRRQWIKSKSEEAKAKENLRQIRKQEQANTQRSQLPEPSKGQIVNIREKRTGTDDAVASKSNVVSSAWEQFYEEEEQTF